MWRKGLKITFLLWKFLNGAKKRVKYIYIYIRTVELFYKERPPYSKVRFRTKDAFEDLRWKSFFKRKYRHILPFFLLFLYLFQVLTFLPPP